MGAWIEIQIVDGQAPSGGVAPLVGAWIEIRYLLNGTMSSSVAPLVGAWIEIQKMQQQTAQIQSLLSWERGLKYADEFGFDFDDKSLLSWERGLKLMPADFVKADTCRSSRGSVD